MDEISRNKKIMKTIFGDRYIDSISRIKVLHAINKIKEIKKDYLRNNKGLGLLDKLTKIKPANKDNNE